MKNFWNAIDRLNAGRVTKYELTAWIMVLAGALLGAVLGLVLTGIFSLSWQWGLIPVLACAELSVPALFFYACRHDYHNGRFLSAE